MARRCQSLFLAQRRISRKGMGIGAEVRRARQAVAAADHRAGEREQHLVIITASPLGRWYLQCVKAPGQRGHCFVGGKDSLASRDQTRGEIVQLLGYVPASFRSGAA